MISLFTVLISGVFGLLVALTTFWLAARKEQRLERRSIAKEKYQKIFSIYTDEIACLHNVVRYTERMMDYQSLFDEMSKLSAQMFLLASPSVQKQAEVASDLIFAWSSEYRRGQPERVSEGVSMISSSQTPHVKKAQEIFPGVTKAILDLIAQMKAHLQEIEPDAHQA